MRLQIVPEKVYLNTRNKTESNRIAHTNQHTQILATNPINKALCWFLMHSEHMQGNIHSRIRPVTPPIMNHRPEEYLSSTKESQALGLMISSTANAVEGAGEAVSATSVWIARGEAPVSTEMQQGRDTNRAMKNEAINMTNQKYLWCEWEPKDIADMRHDSVESIN